MPRQAINLSLTALGDVLGALSRNASIATHELERHKENARNAQLTTSDDNGGGNGGLSGTGAGGVGGAGDDEGATTAAGGGGSGAQQMVPVPYRNSKLTHLLKV